ncbi:MAG: hypothetical protein A2Y14_04630 [Verrucomicrobia bacterium GWF2_51_19]|nr:MAG: hypothetical protein A2Y14_04630 [Verrucomicrobia bacterium GWF2_51_19]HCJ12308.1 DedA family protein [Opitutae bacterium]
MDLLAQCVDVVMHLDMHVDILIQSSGLWIYAILFAVIFAETGLVVTPFLPGDSFLFVLGAFAARGSLQLIPLTGLLIFAAVLGDSVNYSIGKYFGHWLLKARLPFFKKEYLAKTHRFFEKYGGKTIVLARFIPIVRTFAPFVAGMASMRYPRFFTYNVIGGIAWIVILMGSGFLFGNMKTVKEHFSLITFIIIFLSICPAIIEWYRSRRSLDPVPSK